MAQEYRENLRLALDTLLSHKLRSFLTMLGVVMGVGVLMLVAALLTGFNQSVVETITSFGADTASVSRFSQGPRFGGPRPKEERLRKPLTFEDGEALSACCASIKAVTIWITQWEKMHQLRYQGNEVDAIDRTDPDQRSPRIASGSPTAHLRVVAARDEPFQTQQRACGRVP